MAAPALSGKPVASGLRAGLGRVWRLMRGGEASPWRLGASVALGLFIGCLPLYGLHLPLCLGACLLLRLDAVVAYLAANVSNPLMAPFLLTAEVELGSLLLTGQHAAFDLERARRVGVSGFLAQAGIGSVGVGGLLALLGGLLVFALSARRSRAKNPELTAAVARTIARYAAAPIADRQYVAGKLRHDPVLARIVELKVELGVTVDAGAGRGQLALCLFELGLIERLSGFDLDARKVALAAAAAKGDAEFAVGDLGERELPEADSILLVDVLHYLPLLDQNALLRRAAAALRPGGRLLIRDADKKPGASSILTQALEYLATATRWHRSRSRLCFRPMVEVVRELESLGLDCQTRAAAQGTPLDNVLIVATRRSAQPPASGQASGAS